MASPYDFQILQGTTFQRVVRWEAAPVVYKAITAITQAAPVSITAAGHGLVDGWRVAITAVRGMTEINAEGTPPRASEYHKVTFVDADTVTINDINAASFKAYTSGGYLQYNTPVSLSGFTARMTIRETLESTTTLMSLTTSNSGITLDDTAKTISLYISATDTAAIDWTQAVYDLEMVSGSGVVTRLLSGSITVSNEVTR